MTVCEYKPISVTVHRWQTQPSLGSPGPKSAQTHWAEPSSSGHPVPPCSVSVCHSEGRASPAVPLPVGVTLLSLHSTTCSAPPHLPEGQLPTGKFLPAPSLSEHLFSCFFVCWSVAVINETEGEPHSLPLPLPTHINLNANSLRKIKSNYAFCSRLHGK